MSSKSQRPPNWLLQQFPAQLETTIRATLAYFQQATANYLHPNQDSSADLLAKERRQAALENANAAAAAQRLFSEPRHVQGDVEAIATLILYIRRFFNSLTTLAEHCRELSGEYQCPDRKQFADAIVQVLENLADALQQRQPPRPLPDLNPYLEAIRDRVERLMPSEHQSLHPIQAQQHLHCKRFENALPFPQNWIELPRKSPAFMVRSSACKNQTEWHLVKSSTLITSTLFHTCGETE